VTFFTAQLIPWLTPGGAIGFSPTQLPRTLAEVSASLA
jgi:hypothetical protein